MVAPGQRPEGSQRWNGTDGRALAFGGGTVYVGGLFTNAGGVPANNVAAWNGSAWSALGGGLGSNVNALAVVSPWLYAAGSFSTAGGAPASLDSRRRPGVAQIPSVARAAARALARSTSLPATLVP